MHQVYSSGRSAASHPLAHAAHALEWRRSKKCGRVASRCVAAARKLADTASMIAARDRASTCGNCGAVLEGDWAFCRLYEGKSRILFCGPRCVQEYLLVSHCNGSSPPGGNLVEEIVAEWRWRELGR